MKRLVAISCTIFLATLSFFSQSSKGAAVRTVPSVDLNKYSGVWYEIAKYPNKFQKDCVADTTATYSLKGEDKLEVLNRCQQKDGTMKQAKGAGKVEDTQTRAKLKVRFAPGFLSFLPAVWGDYWIIDLAPDYSYSVIGTPDRKYFWVLSRRPEMEDSVYEAILSRAEQQGFVPGKVVKSPQGVGAAKGAALPSS